MRRRNATSLQKQKRETEYQFLFFAVRTRFELVVRLPVRQFSKLVVSATHPPHQSSVLFPIASAKVVYFSLTTNFHIAFFTNLSKVTINQHKGWMMDGGWWMMDGG